MDDIDNPVLTPEEAEELLKHLEPEFETGEFEEV